MSQVDTSAGQAPLHQAKSTGDAIANARWFEWLARAGLVARGAIYGIIGVLALEMALGAGGKTTNQSGALGELAKQPGGKILLVLMAIGLFGYAFWRLLRAAVGHGPEESDDGLERFKGLDSGIAYAGLFVTCVTILLGSGGGSSSPDKATGGVLGWPGGQVIVAIAGLVLIGVGLFQGYEGVKKKFLEKSKTEQMSETTEAGVHHAGDRRPSRAHGRLRADRLLPGEGGDRLRPRQGGQRRRRARRVAKASYGKVLLAIVAAGTIAFGAYSIADARYRRV